MSPAAKSGCRPGTRIQLLLRASSSLWFSGHQPSISRPGSGSAAVALVKQAIDGCNQGTDFIACGRLVRVLLVCTTSLSNQAVLANDHARTDLIRTYV
jgi:hypothetical protein